MFNVWWFEVRYGEREREKERKLTFITYVLSPSDCKTFKIYLSQISQSVQLTTLSLQTFTFILKKLLPFN